MNPPELQKFLFRKDLFKNFEAFYPLFDGNDGRNSDDEVLTQAKKECAVLFLGKKENFVPIQVTTVENWKRESIIHWQNHKLLIVDAFFIIDWNRDGYDVPLGICIKIIDSKDGVHLATVHKTFVEPYFGAKKELCLLLNLMFFPK